MVRELISQGHEVVFATVEEYKEATENTGAQVYIYKDRRMAFTAELFKKFGSVYANNDPISFAKYFILWGIDQCFASLSAIKDLQQHDFDMVFYDQAFYFTA